MTGKDYAKAHGGNVGLEKAFIAGQRDMLEKLKKQFEYGSYYMNAVAFTKHQVNIKIDDIEKSISVR